jgi:uncharacterized protein YukE
MWPAWAALGAVTTALLLVFVFRGTTPDAVERYATPAIRARSDAGRIAASTHVDAAQRERASDGTLLAVVAGEFAGARDRYQGALGRLRAILEQDIQGWSRERQSAHRAQIKLLDEALTHTTGAARQLPADPKAQEMLFRAYRRQIAYLQDALLSGSASLVLGQRGSAP